MAEQYANRTKQHRESTVNRLHTSDAFKPLVLVVASKGAKLLAQQNGGLGIEDLLNPFATVRGSVPIRNKERSYNLQRFGVRFVDVDHLMPATEGKTGQLDQILASIVKQTPPGSSDTSPAEAARERFNRQQIRSPRDINRFFERTSASNARSPRDAPNMSPWWTKVIDELSNEGLRGQQWDMFCHPIVLLYVVSSTSEPNQEDPVALASLMLDPRSLPRVMTSGQYNRNVPSMILLVHDNQKESIKKPESLAKKISSSTGMPKELVRVLRLNSYSATTSESADQPDLWSSYMSFSASLRAQQHRQREEGAAPPVPRRPGETKEGGGSGSSGGSGGTVVQPNVTRLGGRLSPEDMINIQNFMSDLIQNVVIHQIESRIFSLTASVAKSKGGMRNALKSWWRKPKEATSQAKTANGDVLLYESSSVESQVRLLADLLFMVHDYSSAQHYYTMVKSDYKSDKAWLHHASCSMMIALCGFAAPTHRNGNNGNNGGSSSAHVQQYIEDGLQPLLADMHGNGSNKWGTSTHYQWLTTRMTLWSVAFAADMYRSAPFGGIGSLTRSTKYLLACAWYESASGSSLISGMMQEQAFLCTLSVPNFGPDYGSLSTIALRRAAQQMVQAGHRYLEHGLVQHALHCYAAVAPLYEEGWSMVDTHVQHSMSTQLASLGARKEASETMLKLIQMAHPTNTNHILMSTLHPQVQGIIMKDLFRIVGAERTATGKEDTPLTTMRIPTVMDATIRTMVNENPSETSSGTTTNSGWSCIPVPTMSGRNPTAVRRAKDWGKLLSSASWCRRGWDIMKNAHQHRDNLEYIGTKEKQKDRASPPQWCSVKEPVEIDFVLHNPLDVEMHLKHILLSAHIDRDGGGGGGGGGGGERSRGSSVDQASVELPTISQLTLPPKSNTTLRMRVVPLREGVLTIEGIQWRLCPTSETPETVETVENNRNTILCLHDFDLLGEKLHDTRDHRAMGARAKDTRLQVTVVGPRPWVGMKLATQAEEEGGGEEGNIVANVVAGQLIQLSLTLTNLGDAPAHYVTLSSSSDIVPLNVGVTSANGNGSLFRLPVTPLGINETRIVPLTLRAPSLVGQQDIYVMIEYSNEVDIPIDIVTRALRLCKTLRRTRAMITLNVSPSLSLDAFVRPTFDTKDEFILGVVVQYPLHSASLTTTGSASALSPPLRLTELASLSPRFVLTRRDVNQENILLHRGESMTLYYDVKVHSKDPHAPPQPDQKQPDEEEQHQNHLGNHPDNLMHLCDRLLPSSPTITSWTLKNLQDLTTSSSLSSSSSVSSFVRLDHVKSMVSAMKQHKRQLKRIEDELLGPSEGAQSIEDVRRRRNKLIALKQKLGMSAKEEDIPEPWGQQALGWNATGSVHLIALWEVVPARGGGGQEGGGEGEGEGEEEEETNGVVARQTMAVGMTTKLRIPIRPDKPDVKDPTRTCPLMLSCEYPELVQHGSGFTSLSPCCVVPVVVKITNGAPIGCSALTFTFDVVSEPGHQFTWSGMTRSILTLKPGETASVGLRGHFLAPGTYDINQFRLHIDVRASEQMKENIVSFKFPSLKYLVRVVEEEEEGSNVVTVVGL